MSEPATNAPFFTTAEAFLAWVEARDERFEFLDGRPSAMTGGSRRHAVLCGRVFAGLDARLRGGPCRAFTGDLAIRTGPNRVRFPDASVACAPGPKTYAQDPTVVVEVLSPSTAGVDLSSKMDEYLALPSLRHYLVLHQDAPRARLWSRADPGASPPAREIAPAWRYDLAAGEDAVVPLGAIGVTLPLAELYADLPPEDEA